MLIVFLLLKAGMLDSQATSKAGLSINSQNTFELQQLKVIVPDEFAPYEYQLHNPGYGFLAKFLN